MPTHRFFHLTLRTHDTAGARSFYADVFGDTALDVVKLHEQAVARGARPHWLGFIEVADVDGATAAFMKCGATALGSKWVNPEGLEAAYVREPGGALIALAKPPPGWRNASIPGSPEPVFHQLNTIDVDRAKSDYRTLFGWSFGDPVDLGEHGIFHPFSWEPGGAPVGWMTDIFQRPGRHPHWLFHFPVPAFDPALSAVRRGGGYVIGVHTLAGGEKIAVCDDSQGAAFAIRSTGGTHDG